MNRRDEKLFDAIGYIDSDIIESAADALSGKKKYKKPVVLWRQMIAAAVIITLLAAVVLIPILNLDLPVWTFGNSPDHPEDVEKDPCYNDIEGKPNPEGPIDNESNDSSGDGPNKGPDVDSEEGVPDLPYEPFTAPLSSSNIYGTITEINALTFDNVWGAWEVITEGENAGAVHSVAGKGACIAVINNVDLTKAQKVTISADIALPSKFSGNNSVGFVMDVWATEDFYWEKESCSYYYLYHSGRENIETFIGKWGVATIKGEKTYGWNDFNESHGLKTNEEEGLEFAYGQFFNLKAVWDLEYEVLSLYYNGVLTQTIDLEGNPFVNQGNNACGLRSNRDDVYFKNINLIVEGDVTAEATPEEGKENKPEDKYEDLPEDKPPVDIPYIPFTAPLSTSTVYGITTEKNALTFDDLWGAWEVITEGEHEGALHLTSESMTGLALINNVDFTKAKNVTLSADIMLPEKASMGNDVGFVMNMWISPEDDQYFHWTDDSVSYFYCFNTGFGKNNCMIGKWGETKSELKYKKGLHTFEKADGVVESEVEKADFKYGEYFNLKAVWDAENHSLAVYCDGQLYTTIDFDSNPFTNEGDNACGLRANRGDVYFKNINLIVE